MDPNELVDIEDTAPLPIRNRGCEEVPPIKIEFGAVSDVGKVRTNNEDQYLVARLTKSIELVETSLSTTETLEFEDLEGYLYLVADGMGGHLAGERASAIVAEEVRHYILHTARWFFQLQDPDEEARLQQLREAVQKLDEKIVSESEADPSLRGMGTTLTAALSYGDSLFIIHVGDSRAYLVREGTLTQITRDHTLAQQLVDGGILEPEEARTNRGRHVLTNSMGSRLGVDVDILKVRIGPGDRVLLCSDGLTDDVSDERIQAILAEHSSPQDASKALLEAGLEGKAKDNITLVVADYSEQTITQ